MWKIKRASAFLVVFPRIQGPPPGLEKEEPLTPPARPTFCTSHAALLEETGDCFGGCTGGPGAWGRGLRHCCAKHALLHRFLQQALVVMVAGLAVFWLRCACCRCAGLQSEFVCPP